MASHDEGIPRVIHRGLPNAVTYDLTQPQSVRITLPTGSTWTSGLHWHETHVEYLQVLQGSIKVQLNGKTQIIHASPGNQPEIKVEKYAWHEWQRANHRDGEDVVVIERTVPADGEKSLFFWNLNGVILDAPSLLDNELRFAKHIPLLRDKVIDWWISLNLFVIFHHLDNMPVFLPASDGINTDDISQRVWKWTNWAATHSILLIAAWLGRALGVQAVRLKYTPMEEFARWAKLKTS